MRVAVAAVLVAALAAGCDDNPQKYSRSDVERAFRSQGLELLAPNRFDEPVPNESNAYLLLAPTGEDRLLAPKTTDEQVVIVIFAAHVVASSGLRPLMPMSRRRSALQARARGGSAR
jgi:hypothetical protein